MPLLKIYTIEGCPFCIKAKAFLAEKGIEFEEVPAGPNSEDWQQMKKKTRSGSVPQICINGEPLGGYSDLVYLEATGILWEKLGRTDRMTEASAGESGIYDLIVVGGGPAGLSAGIYAARKLMKTLLIARDIGGQVVWTYDIDNYLGFTEVDTAGLISKFNEHVEKYNVVKREGIEVISVELSGRIKKVTTDDNNIYLAKTVIIATGKRPRPLGVPGEKEFIGRGVAYCSTCDAPLYVDLAATVVGGGNSALEAVIDLEKVATRVHLVSLTPLTGDPILTEKVEGMEKVDIYTEYNTTRIIGEKSVTGIEIESVQDGQKQVLDTDGVFIEIGLLPNSDLIIDTLTTNRIGEITVDSECRTGMTGVFAAGDVTNVPFKQVIVAAGEGAKAALSAYNYLINQK